MFLFALVLAAADPETPMLVSAQHDVWVDEAQKLLDSNDADGAVPLLTRYLGDVQNRPQTANLSLLGRAWLLLSTAHFQRGKEDEGRIALDELVRLRPDLQLDASYPPLFVRLHQKAQQRTQEKAQATLLIAAPEDASLLLNGRRIGPSTVTNVPGGVHFIAWQLGTKQVVKKVDVKASEKKYVTFGGAAHEDNAPEQSYFALTAPKEPVAVAQEPPKRPRALGSGNESPRVIVVPQAGEEPREEKKALVVAPGEADRQRQVAQTRAEAKPLYKQWWLWTIVGVVVAGATTTAVLVATAKVGDVAINAEWR